MENLKSDKQYIMKWEYKILYNPDFDKIQKAGEEGWELVNALTDFYACTRFYFKRLKQ